MNCVINGALFLRSNGNLVCWDDTGRDHVLAPYSPTSDYGNIYLGETYNRIRKKLKKNTMPFPDICKGCLAFKPKQQFDNKPTKKKLIKYLQVESSFSCNLRCPNCYPAVDRKKRLKPTEAGHLFLNRSAFNKVLNDIKKSNIDIELIEFQGHGEPLLNSETAKMIATSRECFPDSNIRLVTNACFDYTGLGASGLSEIFFSVDGVDQRSYEPYRVRGKFDKAFRFMKEFCDDVKNRSPEVRTVWKYILFEHNSSKNNLKSLVNLAKTAGVKEIHLIVTQLGPSSIDFFLSFVRLQLQKRKNFKLKRFESALNNGVDVRFADKIFRKFLDISLFPEEMLKAKNLKIVLISYMSLQEDISQGLQLAENKIHEGCFQESGNAALDLADKIWRLYDGKKQHIIKEHTELMLQSMALIPHIPVTQREKVLNKFSVFAPHIRKSTESENADRGADTTGDNIYFIPCNHVSGEVRKNTTSFVLFSRFLSMPEVEIKINVIFKEPPDVELKARIIPGYEEEFVRSEERSLTITSTGETSEWFFIPNCRRIYFELKDVSPSVQVKNIQFVFPDKTNTAQYPTEEPKPSVHLLNWRRWGQQIFQSTNRHD